MTEKDSRIDLNGIFETDAQAKRKKYLQQKQISFREYLNLVEDDPLIAQNSYSRAMEIILAPGTEIIPQDERWSDTDTRYPFFSQKLFGIDDAIYNFINYIRSGQFHASTARQLVLLVGPPAAGKSTIVRTLMEGYEQYKTRPVFMIKDCPKYEEPLHLLPRNMRKQVKMRPEDCNECSAILASSSSVNKKLPHIHLGVTIEGDLCPHCRHLLETHKSPEDGVIRWWDIPVETFTFSIQASRGLTSFEPSDEKSADISTLCGRENVHVTMSSEKGAQQWNAYDLTTGQIPRGERGIVEGRELLASDREVLKPFFSVAEERQLKIQGSTFPHLSVDTIIVAHTNLAVFKDFSSPTNDKNEGLQDRFLVIPIRYPLRIEDEISLYEKLIAQESDFVSLKKCHIAPGTLELSALFATMTRLTESNMGVTLLDKAKAYNGDRALLIRDKESASIDLRALYEEGQRSEDIAKREGMFGVSSRTILAALNKVLAQQADRSEFNGCLTPLRAINALNNIFDQRMGFSPEEIKQYRMLLTTAEQPSVWTEYRRLVIESVKRIFLGAYHDMAVKQFNEYIEAAQIYRNRHRKFAQGVVDIPRDELGRAIPIESFEKTLHAIEIHVPIGEAEADNFRGEILELKASMSDFSYDTYAPLAKAVDTKLFEDSKELFRAVLTPDKPKTGEESQRAKDLFSGLLENNFCKTCATEYIRKTHEFMTE